MNFLYIFVKDALDFFFFFDEKKGGRSDHMWLTPKA